MLLTNSSERKLSKLTPQQLFSSQISISQFPDFVLLIQIQSCFPLELELKKSAFISRCCSLSADAKNYENTAQQDCPQVTEAFSGPLVHLRSFSRSACTNKWNVKWLVRQVDIKTKLIFRCIFFCVHYVSHEIF